MIKYFTLKYLNILYVIFVNISRLLFAIFHKTFKDTTELYEVSRRYDTVHA